MYSVRSGKVIISTFSSALHASVHVSSAKGLMHDCDATMNCLLVFCSLQQMEATEEQLMWQLMDSLTFLCWIRKTSMTSWFTTQNLKKFWLGKESKFHYGLNK